MGVDGGEGFGRGVVPRGEMAAEEGSAVSSCGWGCDKFPDYASSDHPTRRRSSPRESFIETGKEDRCQRPRQEGRHAREGAHAEGCKEEVVTTSPEGRAAYRPSSGSLFSRSRGGCPPCCCRLASAARRDLCGVSMSRTARPSNLARSPLSLSSLRYAGIASAIAI